MSDITKAIMLSHRVELIDSSKRCVGYDIFHIVGHTTIGDEVYLVLGNAGWVRSKDALIERQKEQWGSEIALAKDTIATDIRDGSTYRLRGKSDG